MGSYPLMYSESTVLWYHGPYAGAGRLPSTARAVFGRHSFILPNDKNAIGLTVYIQFAIQDQKANLLGWAFSNALGLTIGG